MLDTIHTIAVTALVEHEGRFLFIKRPLTEGEFNDQWVFPGGKVHSSEDICQALLRELLEEVGVSDIVSLQLLSAYKFTRKNGSSTQGLVFLARARSAAVVIDDASASACRWIEPEEVVDDVMAGRTIYGMEV